MACKKVQLRREKQKQKHSNDVAEAMESAMTDAFFFATMCIVGMCVDVHTKDGSVFAGVFYTASVDKDYAIVLKNASMIKKGNRHANVGNGTLVETLIIRVEDLVQVVAKGVQLPSNGILGVVGGDRAEIRLHYGEALLNNNSESSSNNNLEVKDEAQEDHELHLSKEATAKHARSQDMPTSVATLSSTVDPPHVSVPTSTHADVNSESGSDVSPNPYISPSKSSGFEKNVKESKLNPGAAIFSPSMLSTRISSPIVPMETSFPYMPGTYATYAMGPYVSTQEVDESSLSHSHVPVKFVPRNNITSENFGYGASYNQPMMGQFVNRSQVRYGGLYQQIPSAPAYYQQSPQNVMIGQAEPIFSMHPVSGDIVQSAAGFSPANLHPPFPIHQAHPPKPQGNFAHQAAMNQLPFAPQIMAPPSQAVFPILHHPATTQGSNNYMSAKFV